MKLKEKVTKNKASSPCLDCELITAAGRLYAVRLYPGPLTLSIQVASMLVLCSSILFVSMLVSMLVSILVAILALLCCSSLFWTFLSCSLFCVGRTSSKVTRLAYDAALWRLCGALRRLGDSQRGAHNPHVRRSSKSADFLEVLS